MRSVSKLRLHLFSLPLIICLTMTFLSGSVNGQPPTPPPTEESWNPPNEGPSGGRGHYEMAGWSTTYTLTAWTADIDGNPKNTFNLDEEVYLYVDTPTNWLDNRMWLYEYHQSDNSSGRWLFWWIEIGPGRFMFGPFYPDKFRPSGNYTWKIWILEPKSGVYQDQLVTFTYSEVIPEFPEPTVGFMIVLVLVLLVFLTRATAGHTNLRVDPSPRSQ